MAHVDRAARRDRRRTSGGGPHGPPAGLGVSSRPGARLPAGVAEAIYDVWAVRQAVGELPDNEQEIVHMQHFEGLTHGEIAERLQLPVGTVKSRSSRAHKRLAALLGHLRE